MAAMDEETEGTPKPAPVIEAEELARRLGSADVVIVDCRFDLSDPEAGRAAYAAGHIPGARYADLDKDLSRPPAAHEGRHPLPDASAFAHRLGGWGVSNASLVVAYDGGPGVLAARLWWMLRWLGQERAAVLNGGFERWRSLGLPLEQAAPAPEPAVFAPVRVHDEWVVDSSRIGALAQQGALVDVRAPARFRGEREPIDAVAGHVPGARNFPFNGCLAPDGRLHEPAELRRALEPLVAGRPESELVAMCGSGVTACHLLWAMEAAGLAPGRLYVGSWSEWIRDPARPVATGE
jgi:thiosulfate/3-mercaptopyruvate sulfurtransferase